MSRKKQAFTGCGGTSVGGSATGSGSGKTVVTVMQQNSENYVYFTNLGKEFTKQHPDIEVKYIGVPLEDFDTKLQTMIASGTQPDITTHVSTMGFMHYYYKDLLTDLTPYIEKYNFNYKDCNIPDSTWNMATVNGKQYGIPLNLFTTILLYNKDIFDKAGVEYPPSDYSDETWTFDKMVEIAKKLTSGSGQSATYGLYWSWDGASAMQAPRYFKANLFDIDPSTGLATRSNFSSPEVINAYQRIADLAFKDKVSPTPAYIQALGGIDPFLSGNGSSGLLGACRS